jgi:glycosyltransferase involved in cell wall biosynthesis
MPTVIMAATVSSHLRLFHLPWVRRLRASGTTVIGVASDIGRCAECRDTFDSVEEVPFSRNPFCVSQVRSSGKMLRVLLRESAAQLVHFHTPNAAFWGRLALRTEAAQNHCKIAYTAHGFHFHKNGGILSNYLYRSAERLAARYTHALLTINSDDAEEATRFRLAAGGFHERLPGAGVDLNRLQPAKFSPFKAREKLCVSLGIPASAALVLMVAELIPRKRHGDAVSALAHCAAQQMHLLLAGTGSEESKLRTQVEKLRLTGLVHFLGFRPDVPELLSAADVVVLPSGQEGLPVCVLEAMAMERPVIVANSRGSRDLVEPDCGWVHEIGDTGRLASLLQQVLKNPEEAVERARKARARVVSQYTWPIVQERLTSVYRRLGVPI